MFRNLDKSQSFPEMEERLQKLWEADDSFKKSVQARPAEKAFIFYDGPPFATGLPHYGHLLAGTIKDIVPRYWAMQGYDVERRFGWDCHGLPIESLIEKELGLARQGRDRGLRRRPSSTPPAARACCATRTSGTQAVQRMGRWVDFENDYKTMDPSFMETVWWVFKQLWDKGLIYEGFRIQPVSPGARHAAVQLRGGQGPQGAPDPGDRNAGQDPSVCTGELEDETRPGAWTTTPWTLPSNLALAVHPDVEYRECASTTGEVAYREPRRLADYQEARARRWTTELAAGQRAGAGRRYEPLLPYLPRTRPKKTARAGASAWWRRLRHDRQRYRHRASGAGLR